MTRSVTSRWEYTRPTPLGEEHACYEFTSRQFRFDTDAVLGPGEVVIDWDEISEAATAMLDPSQATGGDGVDWMPWNPMRLEWLLVSRRGDTGRAFMQPLPNGDTRAEIVAQLRDRLGARFVGERQRLESTQQRFRIGGKGEALRAAAMVVVVLAMLAGLLMLLAALLSLPFLDASVTLVFGAWLLAGAVRRGRDVMALSGSRPVPLSAASPGTVALAGRASTMSPVLSGVSGEPSVWWDVGIDVWQERDGDDEASDWVQIAARHGGRTDALLFEDATGRVPVWLRDADLYLAEHTWESGKDALPAPGHALLDAAGLGWDGHRIRVREQRMAVGSPLHVLGTLGRGADLLASGADHGVAAHLRWLRTGAWRSDVVRRFPPLLRMPLAVTIGYVGMLAKLGMGGARAVDPEDAARPPVGAEAPVLWKGRHRRAFVIADRAPRQARSGLMKQALVRASVGGPLLAYWIDRLTG